MASFDLYLYCGLTAILAYLIYKCATLVTGYMDWLKLGKSFAHLPFHWFLGTLHLIKSVEDIFIIHKPLVKAGHKAIFYWLGPQRPVLITVNPETVKVILKSTAPKSKGAGGYNLLLPWLGDGLLISDGKKWERNRKLLTAAFHFEILQPYVGVYNSVTEVLLKKLEKANGEFIEVFEPVSLATLDTMLQCAFSYQGNIQQLGKHHPYVVCVQRMCQLLIQRSVSLLNLFTPYYKLTKNGQEFFNMCDYVHQFSTEIINKRKVELQNKSEAEVKKRRHLDFLDILLTAKDENGESLTDIEIRDEVDTFLFEGHDTTASAISWCFYALARYPQIQEKVFDDVSSVLDVSTDLQWKDLSEFTFLPLFIKEALRYYSPVPAISRQVKDPMVIDNVKIPKDTIIDINMVLIHHNPNIWPDPEEFKPERFTTDAIDSRDPYAFVPFSAGPRNCIGQNFAMNEMKTVISRVVHRFRVEYDETRIPEPIPEIITRAKDGLYLRFIPRNPAK
ncbi:hypothetical protein SNE40_006795 [Patella caerulea]|uniref:Cytochrome P450 n=1 Tax=Patella caerulea TaxID=87958 RepID=A0AAN8JWE9_PATCE